MKRICDKNIEELKNKLNELNILLENYKNKNADLENKNLLLRQDNEKLRLLLDEKENLSMVLQEKNDVEKKSGTIFNFSDVLECGNLGICGILNMEDMPIGNDSFEMWKMIHDSLHIIAISVKLNEFQPLLSEDKRTDYIDIADIFNKINKHYNNLLLIKKKKKNSYYNSSIVK